MKKEMKKRTKKWINNKKLIKEVVKELRYLQVKIPILRMEINKAQHKQLEAKLQKAKGKE